jgi:ABC-type transport system involved in cytochrome c biogenesis permease subunit
MEIKTNPQGYLIYAAMGGYLLAWIPAQLTAIIRFRTQMNAMVKRAIIFFMCVCVVAAIVGVLYWSSRPGIIPLLPLLVTLLYIAGGWVLVCLIGLAAIGLAWLSRWLHKRSVERLEKVTFFLGMFSAVCVSIATIIVIGAFIYRWYTVRHVPMQNLFEVFLTLGVLTIPISMLGRWLLGIRSLATDLLLGAIVLLPAGFVFNASPQQLPPALQSWLFAPHVAVYMLSYVFMAKAFLQAVFQVWTRGLIDDNLQYERATYQMVYAGFPLLTLGLILGSYWGKLAWGDYWAWDPKELWSLASWLVFLAYFHFRYMFGKKHPNMNSVLAILGMAAIIITLLWVNLSRLFPGMHSYA